MVLEKTAGFTAGRCANKKNLITLGRKRLTAAKEIHYTTNLCNKMSKNTCVTPDAQIFTY